MSSILAVMLEFACARFALLCGPARRQNVLIAGCGPALCLGKLVWILICSHCQGLALASLPAPRAKNRPILGARPADISRPLVCLCQPGPGISKPLVCLCQPALFPKLVCKTRSISNICGASCLCVSIICGGRRNCPDLARSTVPL